MYLYIFMPEHTLFHCIIITNIEVYKAIIHFLQFLQESKSVKMCCMNIHQILFFNTLTFINEI